MRSVPVSRTALVLLQLAVFLVAGIAHGEEQEASFVSESVVTSHAKGFVRSAHALEFMLATEHDSFDDAATVPGKYRVRGKAGPVENQGSCGSCWDFALTTTLRGTLMSAGGDDPGRLSFNYLLNCAPDAFGCNGGDFTAAAILIAPKGAPAYGSDGSYTGTQGSCRKATPIASAATYKMLGTGGTPSFRDIAYVVGVLHRPVSVDVAVDNTWEAYHSGVYNGCSDENPDHINHMVVIEGYSCESAVDSGGHCKFDSNGNLPAGVGTWTIRNSWGTGWGDGGYITTKATDRQGRRCNSVANDALYYQIN